MVHSSQPLPSCPKHNGHFPPEGTAQSTYLFIERLTKKTNPAFNASFQSADVGCFWFFAVSGCEKKDCCGRGIFLFSLR